MSIRRANIRRSTLIGTAVAIAIYGGSGAAYAQQSGSTASGGARGSDTMEEVVVTGIRAGLRTALETKRNASTVMDALAAQDVGKFPDKNLAEAIQRVPGVVLSRDFGEGERISLRGTAPNLTRTLLNGHALATADWFILDQLNTTRSFNYLMLPSDIIGRVAVYKGSQADLEEGGIGGTIDVETRKPLDLDSLTITGSVEAAYSEMSEKTKPNASAMLSWKNAGETFGILGAVTYQDREIRRDGVEVLGYFPYDTNPSPTVTSNVLLPSHIGSALFQQERKRTGGNLTLQFKPTDALELNLSGLYSKFEADNLNENFLAWGTRAIGNGGTLTNATLIEDTAVAGTISSLAGGTADFAVVYDAINRFATAETSDIDLDATWAVADAWTLHTKVGYTDASGNTDAQPFVEFGAPDTFTYDLRGRAPQVSFANTDPTVPSDMQFIFSSLHQILNDDSEKYAYADVLHDVEWGAMKSIKLGAKFTDHDRELRFNATFYGGFHQPINMTPAATFAGGPTPADFLADIASAGTLREYWQIDRNAVDEVLFGQLANTTRVLYPQQSFAVNETAYAGFAMANFEGDNWRGNLGLRYVRTEQTSSGYVVSPTGGTSNPYGNYDPISVDRSYDDWLPSLNVAYDMSDSMILRVSVAKVMARPDFTDIAPRASLNPGSLTGTSGNPNLDPYRANQADLSLEWYPGPNASFAAGLYYKDIESFITDAPTVQTFPVQSATSPNLACTPAGTNLFNCPFVINQRTNGGGGRIQGFELTATAPLGGGFGLQANYTFSDAEADSGDPIPGASKDTFNLQAYYETGRASVRLAYTYRSDWFVAFDRSTQLNQKAFDQLDAQVSFNVTDHIQLSVEGQNLLDEDIIQYASDTFRPRGIYDNGRMYFAGVRVKF